MPIAVNPDTGAAVYLDDAGAWQPAHTAINPETKETLAFDGNGWSPVKLPKSPAPDQPVTVGATADQGLEGIPILGNLAHRASAAIDAAATGISNTTGLSKLDDTIGIHDKNSQAPDFATRVHENYERQEAGRKAFEQQHPVVSTLAQIAGGTAATLPIGATATGAKLLGISGSTLAGRMGMGALSGGAIGGADAALRGEDPADAAKLGIGIGVAAPVLGRVAGAVVNSARGVRAPAALPANTVDIAGVPVRRSLGQVTGDVDTQMLEQGALRNTAGQREQQVAEDFFGGQNRELGDARDAIANRIGARDDTLPARVVEDPQAAAELTGDAIRSKAAAAKAATTAKYDEFASLPGEIHAGAFEGIAQKIKGKLSLGDNPIIIDDVTTPFASKAIKDVEANIDNLKIQNRADPFGQPNPENIVGISLKGVDQTRKRLVTFASDARASGNAADARAARGVISAFDDHVQDSIDRGLFSGDERALSALKEARASYADYRKTFTSQGAGDDVGRVMEKIVGKNGMEAAPNEVANYLYGSSNIGATGLSVRLGQRLKSVLGEGSAEWSGVKQGLWAKLAQATDGRTEFGPQKASERIFEFLNGSGKALSQITFTPTERGLIQEYGTLLKQLVPKPGVVNHSNTAATLGKMLRGTLDGVFAAGGLHLAGPAGLAAGVVAHKGQAALGDILNATKVARSLYGTPSGVVAQQRMQDAIDRLGTLTVRGAAPALTH